MELRQLRYFLVVAEELHFGRAAGRLHIVQSAVSQQVRRLERELGADLFDRTTRTVTLTAAGRLLVPHAREVCAAADRARAALAGHREHQARTVRLGTSAGLGARLDTLLAEFTRLAPEHRLELVTAATARRPGLVRDGELDAALLRGPPGAGDGLELLEVWHDELLVALPAHRDWADPVELAALAGLPLRIADRARNPRLHDLVHERCRRAGFEPVPGPPFTTDQDVLATVAFGHPCWTVFYRSHTRHLSVPGVTFRALADPIVETTWLAVRPGPPDAGLRTLIQACHAAAG